MLDKDYIRVDCPKCGKDIRKLPTQITLSGQFRKHIKICCGKILQIYNEMVPDFKETLKKTDFDS